MSARQDEPTTEIDERLSAYLDLELPVEERHALEEEMRNDPTLIDRFESLQRLSQELRPDLQDERVTQGVKAAVRQAKAHEARRRRLLWGGVPAGVLALVLGLVILWPQPTAQVTAEDLYAQYDLAFAGLVGE